MTAEEIVLALAKSAGQELWRLREHAFTEAEISELGSRAVYIDARLLQEIENFAERHTGIVLQWDYYSTHTGGDFVVS